MNDEIKMKLIHNYYWVIVGCIIAGGLLFSKLLFSISKIHPLLPQASPAIKKMCEALWCVQAILGIIFLSIWIFKSFSKHTPIDFVYLAIGVILTATGVSLSIISRKPFP